MAPRTDIDDVDWLAVGRDLKAVDPTRYREVLRIARKIIDSYLGCCFDLASARGGGGPTSDDTN